MKQIQEASKLAAAVAFIGLSIWCWWRGHENGTIILACAGIAATLSLK